MQRQHHDDPVDATTLFGFLSTTLGDMAGRVSRLEEHAAEMISGSPRRSELLIVLQDFDLIRQMMEDCARLCTAAHMDGGTMKRGRAETLRLEALREKLFHTATREGGHQSAPRSDTTGSGTVDLFDGGESQRSGDRESNVRARFAAWP